MINIKVNKANLIPSRIIFGEGIISGIIASGILFFLNFFGIMSLFNWIPKGFEVFALVFVAIYIKHLFSVKLGGKEII